jgi:hypothetical protein
LYDLLHPHVAHLVVCNPRKNVLLKYGNKSDRIDARKLAELLRGNHLKPVYHGENGVRTLRELARSYLTTIKDLTRVMSRLKALYRGWAIPCAGRDVYYTRHRAEWLGKIKHAGVRRRAEQLYQHLDVLQQLRQQVRRELLAESRKHAATAKLRQVPYWGPIRSLLAEYRSFFSSHNGTNRGRCVENQPRCTPQASAGASYAGETPVPFYLLAGPASATDCRLQSVARS